METSAIILFLVVLVAFLSYKRGKDSGTKKALEREVESNADRKIIRNMSDSDLDDELRDYWE